MSSQRNRVTQAHGHKGTKALGHRAWGPPEAQRHRVTGREAERQRGREIERR